MQTRITLQGHASGIENYYNTFIKYICIRIRQQWSPLHIKEAYSKVGTHPTPTN